MRSFPTARVVAGWPGLVWSAQVWDGMGVLVVGLEAHHIPVMVEEALAALNVRPGGRYIDCTLGEGGHSLAILSAVQPGPWLLGIDLDAESLAEARKRLAPYLDHAVLVQGNYADVGVLAERHQFTPADGVLFDLGLSSLQLEREGRGFSFSREARLDMRFDPSGGVSAHELVNRYPEQELADIIFQYGEEPRARRIARAIVQHRPVDTTTQLAEIVASVVGGAGRSRIHPATRTFQALRIAVNRELDNLADGLEQAIGLLRPGGRLVVISYHSLEDRLVKSVMQREAAGCICPPGTPTCVCGHTPRLRLVNRKVIRPSEPEVRANPRSRSARMRVAERL